MTDLIPWRGLDPIQRGRAQAHFGEPHLDPLAPFPTALYKGLLALLTGLFNGPRVYLSLVLTALIIGTFSAGTVQAQQPPIDVLHYAVKLEPDITNKALRGSVAIRFVANAYNLTAVEFDCGELTIDSVSLRAQSQPFTTQKQRLRISLDKAIKRGQVQ